MSRGSLTRRINRPLTAAVAAGLALTLAACGGSSTGASSDAADGGKTEITFFSYQPDKVLTPVISAFQAQNPNITIKATYNAGTGGDYATTLQTRIAGGQTPDIFQIVSENRSDIVTNAIAKDLSSLDVMQTVDPAFVDLYRDGDKVYGISFTAWMGGVIYNKDLLAKAGNTEFPKKWDDFITLGQALQKQGITPYYEEQQIASGSLTSLLASAWASQSIPSKNWALNAHPEGQTFAQSWTPVVESWNKAIEAGVLPKDTIGLDGAQIKSAFLDGKVAMYRSGNWDRKDVEAAGIKYGFAAFPAFGSGETYINGGADPAYAIAAKSSESKQAAAAKFLNFMGSKEGVKMLVDGQGAMSISRNYSSDPGETFRAAYEENLLTGRKYWFEWTKGSAPMTAAITAQQQLLFQKKGDAASFGQALDKEFDKLSN